MHINEILCLIQSELVAPKGQRNTFGNYNFRSCEDILQAVKVLLVAHKATITLHDELVGVCDKIFIKATAKLVIGDESISVDAFALHALVIKGMGDAQISGACSSYARKYALNGLLAIDDTKDADATNQHGKGNAKPATKKDSPPRENPLLTRYKAARVFALKEMEEDMWDQEIKTIKETITDPKKQIVEIEKFAGIKK